MADLDFRVIIPTWNESTRLVACVKAVRSALPLASIWVADPGSPDGTADVARSLGFQVVACKKGRGYQLHAGAMAALASGWSFNTVLVFVHADTLLPLQAGDSLRRAYSEVTTRVTLFRTRFEKRHWLLWVYAQFTRFDSFWVSFGDQVIACRAGLYLKAGGFPERPSFEDVAFLQAVRKLARVKRLPVWVTTSARMFVTWGFLRQQWRNFLLMLAYLRGDSPERIYNRYYRKTFSSQPVSKAST